MTLTLFNGSNGENILGKRYRWTSSLFQRTIEQQQPVSKYHKIKLLTNKNVCSKNSSPTDNVEPQFTIDIGC